MKYTELTWKQIETMDKTEIIVLLPLGAVEQHGLHLPLGVDFNIVQALSEAIEARLSDKVLLLPPMWLGHSPHHLDFAGSLSVDHTTYAAMLCGIAHSVVRAGFSKFIMLNGHGGNHLPMQMCLQSLKNEFPSRTDLAIGGFNYWNVARESISRIRESAPGGLGHACELETSLMLHLKEHLVHQDQIQQDGNQPDLPVLHLDMLSGPAISFVYNFAELTESGTFGNPLLASKSKGEQFFQEICREVAELLAQLSYR